MKSIMLSIKPYWLFLIIANKMGWKTDKEKTVEVRKTFPKDKDWNKTVILYCTKDYNSLNQIPIEYRMLMRLLMGKVIGEFVCDRIDTIYSRGINDNFDYCYLSLNEWGNDDIEIEITAIKKSCISKSELNKYASKYVIYAWHISDLQIYDKPKELSEFRFANSVKGRWDNKGNREMTVKKPPQSWCYVEGMICRNIKYSR